MTSISHKFYLQYISFVGAIFIAIGLPLSPALQSIGVAMIFLHAIVNDNPRNLFLNFRKNNKAKCLFLFFLLTLSSLFYTSNTTGYWEDVKIKLPFLLLSVGFLTQNHIFHKHGNKVLFTLIASVFLTGLISFINYLINFNTINEQLLHSKPIPIFTGVNHIYFSILLAFTTSVLIYYLINNLVKSRFKIYIYALTVLSIIFLHTIAARTGLVSFYISVIAIIFIFIFTQKKYLVGIVLGLSFLIFLALSVFFVPPLQKRMVNMKEDLGRYYRNEDINHYSISMRFAALNAAYKVFLKNPIIGVGPADVPDEIQKQHIKDHSKLYDYYQRMEPHNQFMLTAVSLGILGLFSLCLVMFFPMMGIFERKNYVFFLFLIIMLISMQFESVLERQLGVTFFTLFYFLLDLPPIAKRKIPLQELN